MNSYLKRNLMLLSFIVSLVVISVLSASYFIKRKNEYISIQTNLLSVNDLFLKEANSLMVKEFSFVTFLSKTSYPFVALDFGMIREFNNLLNDINLNINKIDIFLLDKNFHSYSEKQVNGRFIQKLIKNSSSQDFSTNNLIHHDDNIYYILPLYKEHRIKGYIVGKMKDELMRDLLMKTYVNRTLNYQILSPRLELIKSNRDNFLIDTPKIKYIYDAPNFLWFTNYFYLFLTLFILFVCIVVTKLLFVFKNSVFNPMIELNNIIDFISNNLSAEYTGKLPKDPMFKKISTSLLEMNRQRSTLETEKRNQAIERNIIRNASQVAHDIRSPLTSLDIVLSCMSDKIAEEPRTLIRTAVQRITDIANDLSGKKPTIMENDSSYSGMNQDSCDNKLSTQLLSALIDSIVSEKRIEYRSSSNIKITANLVNSYGLFTKIHISDFKRVISNLINNAVHACESNAGGNISVDLNKIDEKVVISITDNGKGIPSDIIGKLGIKGNTFGKTDGKGLGLYHAKSSVESWGGNLAISSEINNGTVITISLPYAKAPNWFIPSLQITNNTCIIIVDDDDSIHQVWDSRLHAAKIKKEYIYHFKNARSVTEFYSKNKYMHNNFLFLCDYEFLGDKITGLDIIEDNGIAKYSVLTTSRYEDNNVRERCQKLGVKLLPKSLAGYIPINVLEDINVHNPDYIFIDDAPMNHNNWKLVAKIKKKNLTTFYTADDFYNTMPSYKKDTKIYIDSNLADGIRGEDVAKEIHKKGFKHIYLCTGYPKSSFNLDEMPWIEDIVGKEPPFLNDA